MRNWYQIAPLSAASARRADAGIVVTMLRRCNDAIDGESKRGGTNSSFTLH